MRCNHCGLCCKDTQMELSKSDIKKLESSGHPRYTFVRYDKKGIARLRNRQGQCVFFDAASNRCKAYRFRPAGCRSYPILLDLDNAVVVDSLCPCGRTISENEKRYKRRSLANLIRTIDVEAQIRRRRDETAQATFDNRIEQFRST